MFSDHVFKNSIKLCDTIFMTIKQIFPLKIVILNKKNINKLK